MYFVCPKCKAPLEERGGAAVCQMRHSFDRSREGYFNLLLGSVGGTHGDNKDMIAARRSFLALGHYRPLADLVAEMAEKSIHGSGLVLDAGLGEGYYTEIVAEKLKASSEEVSVIGFDISKDAVKRAAKRGSIDSLAVASSYHMPVGDNIVDLVINIFSPQAVEQTLRVLKPSGEFIMAIPGEEHLFGLKSKIYDTPYKNAPTDKEISGFELVEQAELRYTIKLEGQKAINDLFMMTPYAYRTSSEGRARVLALDELTTDAHFIVLRYRKI